MQTGKLSRLALKNPAAVSNRKPQKPQFPVCCGWVFYFLESVSVGKNSGRLAASNASLSNIPKALINRTIVSAFVYAKCDNDHICTQMKSLHKMEQRFHLCTSKVVSLLCASSGVQRHCLLYGYLVPLV